MELLYILGPLLILAALVDAAWTTLWVDGRGGPITDLLSSLTWKAWRAMFRQGRDRALSLAGPLTLIIPILSWILLLWAGWTLLFVAAGPGLWNPTDKAPAGGWDRVWYTGYLVTTLGNGDLSPRGAAWQVLSVVASFTGLSVATVSFSYIVSVISAVVQKRAFAGRVHSLGDSPEEILLGAWNGQDFGRLPLQLDSVIEQLGPLGHQHNAYPILHYHHPLTRQDSSGYQLAVLDEALTLLAFGVRPPARPDPGMLRAARRSVESSIETMSGSFTRPASHAPPPPDLVRLREAGIPVVDDAVFIQAVEGLGERRRKLLGIVQSDAWPWPGTVREKATLPG